MSMNIPANTAINPELNLGSLLQMLKTADSNQASGAGMNENSEESGNLFCKVLCQQFALLLQSGSSEGTAAAQKALPGILEKLLPDHSDATGPLIAQIEMLLMSGQITPIVSTDASILYSLVIGSQDHSDPATQANFADPKNQAINNEIHGLMPQKSLEATFLSGPQKDGLNASHAAPSKVATESFQDRPLFMKADVLMQQDQGSGKPLLTEEQMKAMGDPDKKMNMSPADAAVTPKVYAASSPEASELNKMPVSFDGRDQIPKTGNVQDLLNEGKLKEPVLPDDQIKKMDASEGGVKRMTFETLDKATQTSIAQDKMLAGQGAVESHLNKTGVLIKNAVLEKDNRQNVSQGLRTDGQLSSSDEKNGISVTPKQSVADIQMSLNGTNINHHNEGKAFAFQMDSMQTNEKTGAAVKNTVLSAGKNVESNLFNTTASGILPFKTESGDVTPSSIINRVASEFRENLMNEGGRVRITLTPPSLGTLEMDVSVQNGKVRVMLLAENKEIQRMLSGNLDTLKGSLQSQGMTIERCDVMMQDRREEYSQGFNGQQAFGHDQAARERNSRREDIDKQSLTVEVAPAVQKPLGHSQLSGSESISLFA
jgi:flagellar hook-length control protein FliK